MGSFAGHLECHSDPEIDYVASQDIIVSVQQNTQILAVTLVKDIDKIGQSFELIFNYAELTGNVQLLFETYHDDDQFNKDNPVTLTQLTIDDLFTIPHLMMSGKLTYNDQLLDTGNVIWQSGKLIYTFNLPIISETKIVKGITS